MAERETDFTEDDAAFQQLHFLRKHPLNLNKATGGQLQELQVLTVFQIKNFLSYRHLLGNFLNVLELQAIPGWDVELIRRLLPYVMVSDTDQTTTGFLKRFKGGDQVLLMRASQVAERSKGYTGATSDRYSGSPQKIFFRYRYNYKNLLQFGILGDKDAGESFFKGKPAIGFDFYSFHLAAANMGLVKAILLGDYTVNLGQGLIHWQSPGFKKSSEVLSIKKEGKPVKAYNSAREFFFNRGVAVILQKNKYQATIFTSLRKLDANVRYDSLNGAEVVSSFLYSGLHRTPNELQDRKRVGQFSFGGNLSYEPGNWHAGINAVHYNFSRKIEKEKEPYNLRAFQGKDLSNFSLDYDYTFRNLHLFGEIAIDDAFSKAFINGVLISLDQKLDAGFLYRNLSPGYRSINANAFTENSLPANETGMYASFSLRPGTAWRIDGYADVFRFPFLKSRVDGPSYGHEYLLQLFYRPSKWLEFYSRFRLESKEINEDIMNNPAKTIVRYDRRSWRTHLSWEPDRQIALKHRIELIWFKQEDNRSETGFLSYIDGKFHPARKACNISGRITVFETDGYDSRVYAFENDLPYSQSVPAFSDRGFRYYFNLNADLNKWWPYIQNRKPKIDISLRWGQTIFPLKKIIGSGSEEIKSSMRSEIKLQVFFAW